MKELLYTKNIGFDLSDWKRKCIRKVYAGTNCIMAITDEGEVLQKTLRPEVAARTGYWTRITEIALSNWASGFAIGLVSDGTCMIAKRAVREVDEECRFDIINNQIKSWKNIVQVAASDAFFGLDKAGNVRYVPLHRTGIDDYRGVEQWQNVKKIVTGLQNSVFAVTADGTVLVEGGNCRRGPKGDICRYTSQRKDVVDLFPTGSECEELFMLLKDGTVVDLFGNKITALTLPLTEKALDGTFSRFAIANDGGNRLIDLCRGCREALRPRRGRIISFAAGDINYRNPFIIAVEEWDS